MGQNASRFLAEAMGHGVFTWMKKEEKGNNDWIRDGCSDGRTFLAIVLDDKLYCPHWQGELWLGCWVLSFVGLVKSGELEVQVVAGIRASWVGISSQHKGLGHMTERSFRCLRLDLTTSALVALPHPSSKTNKQLLLDGLGGADELRVSASVVAKFSPVTPVDCSKGVVHCCSFNHVPASVDITSKFITGIGCTSFQDSSCGRRK
jgi:hypothetical protein